MRQINLILLIVAVFGANAVHAFEENNRFCIHTQPMLLTDIEKHKNPVAGDPHCEILATTATAKEVEIFIDTMCKDYGSTLKEDYQYFKLRNGELNGRGSYQEICNGTKSPMLAWIPYEMIQENFAQELDPKESLYYIAKASDAEREKTDLCHFRHSDLVTNVSANLFSCVLMIFENNFFGLDSNINVLVEIQPIMYEVRNITYLPWINVTTSYKTLLGKTTLKNNSRDKKQIYGSINYAFVEKVKLNTTSVYGDHLEHLPLLFEHKNAVLELNDQGIGGIDVKDKAYFGRAMDSKSSVNVEIIGQWAEHNRQFTADIYEYFGYAIKRFSHELTKGAVSFMTIDNTEPVFEMVESTNLAMATLHKNGASSTQKSDRLTNYEVELTDVDSEWNGENATTTPRGSGHPYPGFFPWAVAGAVIMGLVLLIAVIGMVRTCSKDQKQHKYELTNP